MHYGITPTQVHRKLTSFFRGLGAARVVDTTLARELALEAAVREFIRAYKAGQPAVSAAAGAAAGGELSAGLPAEQPPLQLPVLAAACPGWVCYAEKTQPKALPFLSRARSPQAVAGRLVKELLATQAGLGAAQVYHAAVVQFASTLTRVHRTTEWPF